MDLKPRMDFEPELVARGETPELAQLIPVITEEAVNLFRRLKTKYKGEPLIVASTTTLPLLPAGTTAVFIYGDLHFPKTFEWDGRGEIFDEQGVPLSKFISGIPFSTNSIQEYMYFNYVHTKNVIALAQLKKHRALRIPYEDSLKKYIEYHCPEAIIEREGEYITFRLV